MFLDLWNVPEACFPRFQVFSTLVVTGKIQFIRSDSVNQVNKPTGDSVAAHLYAASKNELEVYHDVAEGLFVANKSQIPQNTCETAQTIWSSPNVTLHRAINPHTPDIVEVSKDKDSEHISILLKEPNQVCGRKVYQTAIPELVVLFLSPHDSPLTNHPVLKNELGQLCLALRLQNWSWIMISIK